MTKNAENGPTREGASTNLVSITPNFIVKNLQASIAFYRERLGFQLDVQGPDDGPFWARVSRDEIAIHFKEIGHDVRSPLTVLRFARSLEPFPTRVHPTKRSTAERLRGSGNSRDASAKSRIIGARIGPHDRVAVRPGRTTFKGLGWLVSRGASR